MKKSDAINPEDIVNLSHKKGNDLATLVDISQEDEKSKAKVDLNVVLSDFKLSVITNNLTMLSLFNFLPCLSSYIPL